MVRLFLWLKIEFKHILFVFIFFFLAFAILNITETVLLKRAGLQTYSIFDVVVAAALVAKVFLIIDHLPFSLLVFKKPLIYLVIWKTILSWITTFLIRMSVRFFPYLFLKGGMIQNLEIFLAKIDWRFLFSVQIWYLMLLFLYVVARELGRVIGLAKVRRIFFGIKS